MTKLLRRIDDAWYRAERALCVALLFVMAISVFLDAVYRQAADEGRLEAICKRVFGESGVAISTVIAFALALWVVYGAVRTSKRATPVPVGKAAVIAVVGVAVGYGVVRGMVLMFPNGLIWAQSLGLAGMLWVGFLGASMATKENSHLTLEVMDFIWRGKAKANIGRVGALCATVFCLVIGWLCWQQVKLSYDEWVESEGMAQLMSVGFEAPLFIVYAVLPFSFTVMALRFFGRVVGAPEKERELDLSAAHKDGPAGSGDTTVTPPGQPENGEPKS
ncbi:MAG: TRAP transporter small permease [Myxococcaceae bacterium]|nr:TRAP transporter small permease [Myxococcaceae bacterium]